MFWKVLGWLGLGAEKHIRLGSFVNLCCIQLTFGSTLNRRCSRIALFRAHNLFGRTGLARNNDVIQQYNSAYLSTVCFQKIEQRAQFHFYLEREDAPLYRHIGAKMEPSIGFHRLHNRIALYFQHTPVRLILPYSILQAPVAYASNSLS